MNRRLTEDECTPDQWRRKQKQARWMAKLKADPVRLAAYRSRQNAAARKYHASLKHDPAKAAARREWGRLWAQAKRATIARVPTTRDRSREARARWQREWRAANQAKVAAYQRAWYAAHPERKAAYERARLPTNKARKAAAYADPVKRDRSLDYFVRRHLAKTLGCTREEVPDEFVQLNRAHLNLVRELRTKKQRKP